MVDAKRILDKVKLRGEPNKTRMSMSLDPETFERFKKLCGDVPLSQVVEELMREFIASAQEGAAPAKKK